MVIVSVCNHPGGVNALLPVLDALYKENNDIYIVTHIINQSFFKDSLYHIQYLNSSFSINISTEILKKLKPNLLLTGTSETENYENKGIEIEPIFIKSQRLRMPSVSILDFLTTTAKD